MRLLELLNEDEQPENNQSVNRDSIDIGKVVNFIIKNCRPWLNETDNGSHAVYRATRRSDRKNKQVYIRRIRKDRYSKDTSQEWTEILNHAIELVGGVANRTNSAFVHSSMSLSKDYGTPFVFIPIGNFNFTWSPAWQDWWAHLFDSNNWRELFTDELQELILTINRENGIFMTHEKFPRIFDDWHNYMLPGSEMSQLIRHDDNLIQAINSDNEIMIAARHGLYIEPGLYDEIIYPAVYKRLKQGSGSSQDATI